VGFYVANLGVSWYQLLSEGLLWSVSLFSVIGFIELLSKRNIHRREMELKELRRVLCVNSVSL